MWRPETHRTIFTRKYIYLPTDIEPFNIREKKSDEQIIGRGIYPQNINNNNNNNNHLFVFTH